MQVGKLDDAEAFTTLDGSSIRELAGAVSLPTENQSLAEARVPPNGETDAHYHRVSEEIYYFVGGSGRMRLGEDETEVTAGDCVVIPPRTEHKLWNTSASEELTLLCCCAPAYSHADTVITEP